MKHKYHKGSMNKNVGKGDWATGQDIKAAKTEPIAGNMGRAEPPGYDFKKSSGGEKKLAGEGK